MTDEPEPDDMADLAARFGAGVPSEVIILEGGRHGGTLIELDCTWRSVSFPVPPESAFGVWSIVGYRRTDRRDAEGRAVFACGEEGLNRG